MVTELYNRRKFFDSDKMRATVYPLGLRYSCPCCGYPTLEERGCYDICRLCWWEDDGQDDDDADRVLGGPNHHYSLTQARVNFEKNLIMYSVDDDSLICGRDSENALTLKKNMIACFGEMLTQQSPDRVHFLWMEVMKFDQGLRDDINARIQEYEATIESEIQ